MQPTILPEPRMTMRLSGFVGWVVLETAFRATMAAKREGRNLGPDGCVAGCYSKNLASIEGVGICARAGRLVSERHGASQVRISM